ncbi:MAG: hypothetical protein K2Y30_11685 [Flavobacteriaceae bacterium]|nr:hypothetical protein [Flavobacteriaceae bacterium]
MKTVTVVMALLFSITVFSQNKALRSFNIAQKECLKRSGYTLVLKEVTTDSRCPQGLTCVWMGEAQVIISLYKNRKLMEDVVITLSSKTIAENKEWFAKYVKEKYKNIQNLRLVPYPKKDVIIKPTDYYLKIEYLK